MEFLMQVWNNGLWGMEPEILQLSVHTLLRLALAGLLGGIIGFERQHSHRPAGMRTHVLVTVGSALVMCMAEYVKLQFYSGVENPPDITRMGAQVISGIGFLGAGTILREGFSVKGLTTAASLWAVACIGLAAGIGFWPGALLGTVVIFVTLNSMKKFAMRFSRVKVIFIGVGDEYHVSEKVTDIFRACGAKLRRLEIIFPEDADTPLPDKDITKVLRALAYINSEAELEMIKMNILEVEGVHDFVVES